MNRNVTVKVSKSPGVNVQTCETQSEKLPPSIETCGVPSPEQHVALSVANTGAAYNPEASMVMETSRNDVARASRSRYIIRT